MSRCLSMASSSRIINTSLLWNFVNYWQKKFYNIGPSTSGFNLSDEVFSFTQLNLKVDLDDIQWPIWSTNLISNMIIGTWNWPSVDALKHFPSVPQWHIFQIMCLHRNNILKIEIDYEIQTNLTWQKSFFNIGFQSES